MRNSASHPSRTPIRVVANARSSSNGEAVSPIRARLRETTSAQHRELEERLDLLNPALSLARYRRILEAFYGFYRPLETALAETLAGAACGFSLPARHLRLERDLVMLGASLDDVAGLPRCASVPALSSQGRGAGCLYVLEGAALGGRIIARAVGLHLALDREHGVSFFAGEVEPTPARWRAVLAWLDGVHADSTDRGGGIVEGACETFRELAAWMSARGVTR